MARKIPYIILLAICIIHTIVNIGVLDLHARSLWESTSAEVVKFPVFEGTTMINWSKSLHSKTCQEKIYHTNKPGKNEIHLSGNRIIRKALIEIYALLLVLRVKPEAGTKDRIGCQRCVFY